jgi:uncharacterized OB-fold protein
MSDPALKYVLREMGAPAREFYRRLEAGELATTRCERCARFHFPPRLLCPGCGGAIVWHPLRERGIVYAFTQQERGLRFTAPAVIGIVELEEGVRVFGVFDAEYDSLAIGQPVVVHMRRDVPGITLLGFRSVTH